MSEQKSAQVREEEPELNDESLEQVAGGCQEGQSVDDGGIRTYVVIRPVES